MVAFIDDHRAICGVEPICRVLPIAPSTYFRWKATQADPTKRSTRAIRDAELKTIILRIWHEHDHAYGSRKVWKQNGPGRTARGPLPRAALDARAGAGRRRPRTSVDHHDAARCGGGTPGGPRRTALRRDAAQSTLGQ